jgi:asparagine synthase (glutamine-hydrolysing)
MFEHMNGMFAFALWDRAAGRVLLARDRLGEKPLYYARAGGAFYFASEIKALLTVPGIRAEMEPDALHEYLTFQYCLDRRTLFKGVERLRPASYLLLRDTGEALESREYWHLGLEEDHAATEEYYIDELRFLLEDAVKIRLRSDVAVGTYLSGGLDSSTVSCVAAKLMGHGLPAFTAYFGEGDAFSELPHARAVAQHNRSPHHLVCPTADDFAASLRKMIYHMDEPAAGPGLFPQYLVSALATQHVKVVLGGQGGDEVFAGYARYLMLYLEESIKGSIFQSQDPARHIVTLGRVLPNLTLLESYVPLLKDFWRRGLFDPIEDRYYSLVSRFGAIEPCLSPEILAGRSEQGLRDAFATQFGATSGATALVNRMTAYDIRTGLQALLQVEDRMSMAASLESRLPLLDHRIVALAFRMPPLYKYRDGKSKAALQTAVKTLLPPSVLARRDKMGLPVPFVEWCRGPLRGFTEDLLLGPRALSRGLLRPEGIRALIASERPFGRALWGLVCLETWMRVFLDGEGV